MMSAFMKREGCARADQILEVKISWQYLVLSRCSNIELQEGSFYLLEDNEGALILGETVAEALSNYATYIGSTCD